MNDATPKPANVPSMFTDYIPGAETPRFVTPAGYPAPAGMSVVLTMDDVTAQQIRQGEDAMNLTVLFANIDSPEMAQAASDERTALAKRIDALKAREKKFLEPAKSIIEEAKELFKRPIATLEAAREQIGKYWLTWDTAEKARAAAAQALIDEEARKIRQKAEQDAAAARAVAAQKAEAERQTAREAEQRRLDAIAAGNKAAAAKAASDAAKALERAQAAQENGDAKAQAIQTEAVASMPAVEHAPVKTAGTSTRPNWVAELWPNTSEAAALGMIVAGVANNPSLIGLLQLNQTALNGMARALKDSMNVPGYVARNRPVLAGSRK